MNKDKRPLTAEEILYHQSLVKIRVKIRDTIENSKEAILHSVDAMISDMMDAQALITNQDKENKRLIEVLKKNGISPEGKKLKKH